MDEETIYCVLLYLLARVEQRELGRPGNDLSHSTCRYPGLGHGHWIHPQHRYALEYSERGWLQ